MEEKLLSACRKHLHTLCDEISSRSVGTAGNRESSAYFEQQVKQTGWRTEIQEFDAIDWISRGAQLTAGSDSFPVQPSPYSNGFQGTAELVPVSSLSELEGADIRNRIVLLHGVIAGEQLMPKNFVFFNPEHHQRIITLLEEKAPAALVCATGRNASLAGGVYPFPLIEDGDLDIPSVYMTDTEGQKLLALRGQQVQLTSDCERIPGPGTNVTAFKGECRGGRIVVSAHIDAKKGTPGAIDNASGVVVLLLLGELLKDYAGSPCVELAALNGEDYYSVPGQMEYLAHNEGRFDEMLLNINIDGAGYKKGPSAFSFYQLPEDIEASARNILEQFEGIVEGPAWVQGDHSIFLQYGVPALAVSSLWFTENIDTQDITHTPEDVPDIVDCSRVVEIALALEAFIRSLGT